MDDCAPVFREEAEDAGADTEVSESAGDRQGHLPLGAIGEGEPEEEVEVKGAWCFLNAGWARTVL